MSQAVDEEGIVLAIMLIILAAVLGWHARAYLNIKPQEAELHKICEDIGSTLFKYDDDTIFCENGASFEHDRTKFI